MHLSFVIEQSPQLGDEEEPCADDDKVPWMGNRGFSDEAKGNSAILSILGELTETFGDPMLWRRPALDLQEVFGFAVLVKNGREARRVGWQELQAEVCDIGSELRLESMRVIFEGTFCVLGVAKTSVGVILEALPTLGTFGVTLSIPISSWMLLTDDSTKFLLKLLGNFSSL